MTATSHHPGLNLGASDTAAHEAAQEVMFGFWIFLMSDLIIFACLFATYTDLSLHGIATAPGPRAVIDLRSALIETGLLLVSSYTFGQASLALKYNSRPGQMVVWLIVTLALGLGFVGMEMRDFATLVGKGITPQQSGFLSGYFTLLATHGLHVIAAMVWLVVCLTQVAILGLTKAVKLRLMRLALFWHMLDIVWIGIFTFVFLIGAGL